MHKILFISSQILNDLNKAERRTIIYLNQIFLSKGHKVQIPMEFTSPYQGSKFKPRGQGEISWFLRLSCLKMFVRKIACQDDLVLAIWKFRDMEEPFFWFWAVLRSYIINTITIMSIDPTPKMQACRKPPKRPRKLKNLKF